VIPTNIFKYSQIPINDIPYIVKKILPSGGSNNTSVKRKEICVSIFDIDIFLSNDIAWGCNHFLYDCNSVIAYFINER